MDLGAGVDRPLLVRLVAEDPLVRSGLARLLERPDLSLVEEGPQVTLLDGGQTGEALARLGGDDPVPVVALVADEAAAEAAAGARGILFRDADAVKLFAALHAVSAGLVVREPELLPERPQQRPGPTEELTRREREVMQLIAEGLSNKEIGKRLGISEHTAKFHVNAILGKLGVDGRTEAVVRAARLGLIVI